MYKACLRVSTENEELCFKSFVLLCENHMFEKDKSQLEQKYKARNFPPYPVFLSIYHLQFAISHLQQCLFLLNPTT